MAIQTTIRDNAATTALIKRLSLIAKDTAILSKEDERAMIEQYRNDPDTLQQKLILHNVRLVFNICKKYALSAKSFDDLVASALRGLCYAAKKFDINKNIKFSTYATNWILKAAREYDWQTRVEKRDPMNVSTSIDQLIGEMSGSSDGNGATMENFIANQIDDAYGQKTLDATEQMSANEQIGIFDRLKNYLANDPEFFVIDSQIFNKRFIEKESYTKISNDLDIPTKEVKSRERFVLMKFREYLKEKMNICSFDQVSFTESDNKAFY